MGPNDEDDGRRARWREGGRERHRSVCVAGPMCLGQLARPVPVSCRGLAVRELRPRRRCRKSATLPRLTDVRPTGQAIPAGGRVEERLAFPACVNGRRKAGMASSRLSRNKQKDRSLGPKEKRHPGRVHRRSHSARADTRGARFQFPSLFLLRRANDPPPTSRMTPHTPHC